VFASLFVCLLGCFLCFFYLFVCVCFVVVVFSLFEFVCLSVRLTFVYLCLFACLSGSCLFVCLLVCLSVCLSICLFSALSQLRKGRQRDQFHISVFPVNKLSIECRLISQRVSINMWLVKYIPYILQLTVGKKREEKRNQIYILKHYIILKKRYKMSVKIFRR